MSTHTLLSAGKAGFIMATALLTLTSCDPYYGGGYGYGGYGYGGGYGYNNYGYGGYGYPVGLRPYVPVYGSSYNYSYYPRYGAYYHRPTHQYHYMSGNRWVSGSTLPGYSPRTIQASHSVPFNFSGHPSNYHSQVSHAFPHNWSPPSGGGGGGSGYRHSSSQGGGWSGSGGGGWNGSSGGGHYGGHRH